MSHKIGLGAASFARIFDSFPSDMQTDVFDAYGTDAAGFPTSYSSCSNPVTIDYVDVMKEGSCFAERVIERTFTSRDQCGNEAVKWRYRFGFDKLRFELS